MIPYFEKNPVQRSAEKKVYLLKGIPPLYVTFSVRLSVSPSLTKSQKPYIMILTYGSHV